MCCDAALMDNGEFLLGRPWLYDKTVIRWMSDTKHIVVKDGRLIILCPVKSESPKRASRSSVMKHHFKYAISTMALQVGIKLRALLQPWGVGGVG